MTSTHDAIRAALTGRDQHHAMTRGQIEQALIDAGHTTTPEEIDRALDLLEREKTINTARVGQSVHALHPIWWDTGLPPQLPQIITINKHTAADAQEKALRPREAGADYRVAAGKAYARNARLRRASAATTTPTQEPTMPRVTAPAAPAAEPKPRAKRPVNGAVQAQILSALAGVKPGQDMDALEIFPHCPACANVDSLRTILRDLETRGSVTKDLRVQSGRARAFYRLPGTDHIADADKMVPEEEPPRLSPDDWDAAPDTITMPMPAEFQEITIQPTADEMRFFVGSDGTLRIEDGPDWFDLSSHQVQRLANFLGLFDGVSHAG